MGHYRVLKGNDQYECETGHKFRALAMYDYSSQQITFETTTRDGQWLSPFERPARTYLPVCPECGLACSYEHMQVSGSTRTNVHVPDSEASAVAIHPQTGEVVYCFGRPDAPMPEAYRQEGFQKVQFNHFRDLQKFCRERGLVNDIEGDWHHEDGYFEEDLRKREKKESERYERYLEEREKVKKAGILP